MDRKKRIITLIVFLLGIFIGAVDTGIISPSRTIIQNSFGINENVGVWMITIYTLVYAVSMPIVSKLSDRYGRKKVYLISIAIFTVGSVFCGLTNFYGSFPMMIGARVIQAIGGGGIVPIATAFVGRSFPEEKRGTALGLVGAIYGIATMLGPSIGSFIIEIAGVMNWGWIFFVNVPIGILILILGLGLEENTGESSSKLDIMGSVMISIVILSLMYALTNINFFEFTKSIKALDVWPYLIIFAVTLPIFMWAEKKAEDPILNVSYFKDLQIGTTLFLAFLTGCGLMGVVFIPQFAENVLRLPSGRGGYMVTLMSIFAGIAAPIGGKLIDKISAKFITILGFTCTTLGTGFLGLYVSQAPSFIGTLIGLAFVGFGMGFTMGTPLNYLMLSYVSKNESASALSAISLVRSIGVTISPNILIGFIAQAGKQAQENIMVEVQKVLPPQMSGVNGMADKINPPNMNMGGSQSNVIIEKMKSSDVTSIVDNVKSVFGEAIEAKRSILENMFQSTLNDGFRNMFIAAAIIACMGIVASLLLSGKQSS